MAMFRDDDFAMHLSAAELTLLIRETGTALLDARLSSSEELSEDDRSQMIRAINKVSLTTRIYTYVRCMALTHAFTLS
jgi:hypothetical protein